MFKNEKADPLKDFPNTIDMKLRKQELYDYTHAGDPDYKMPTVTIPIEKTTIIQKIKDVFKS